MRNTCSSFLARRQPGGIQWLCCKSVFSSGNGSRSQHFCSGGDRFSSRELSLFDYITFSMQRKQDLRQLSIGMLSCCSGQGCICFGLSSVISAMLTSFGSATIVSCHSGLPPFVAKQPELACLTFLVGWTSPLDGVIAAGRYML